MKQRLYLLVLWKIDLNFYILNLQKKKSYFLCRENDEMVTERNVRRNMRVRIKRN